jgi:ATP-dependent protease ClpP protease subunit
MSAAGRVGELFIYDVIGGWFGGVSAAEVARALSTELATVERLDVYINSPGGSAHEGIAIYNALKRYPKPKHVFIDGVCASVASIIAMAGDRIVTAKNGMWMIHDPTAFTDGTAEEHLTAADYLKQLRGVGIETYAARTRQKAADIDAWMAATTWMDPALAKERGFTDEIAEAEEEPLRAVAMSPAAAEFAARLPGVPERLRAAVMVALSPPADPAAHPEEHDMKNLAKMLGLAENATEADILAALTAQMQASRSSTEQLAALLAATGKPTVLEAQGVIAAWKGGAEQVPTLQGELATLKAAGEKAERDSLVATAMKDGKLTPAQKAWAEAQPVATLKAFLETAPVILSAVKPPEERKPSDPAVLDDGDKKVASLLGVNPEEYAKNKAAAAATTK